MFPTLRNISSESVSPFPEGLFFFIEKLTFANRTHQHGDFVWILHTIFGEVVEGYDVVENIKNVATDGSDRTLEEQKIVVGRAV